MLKDIRPVYLYIKKHNITGLLYFGRTINPNPQKYIGSGNYWINHLKKYGRDVSTIFFEKFETQEDATEFALFFTEEFNIVNSKIWANLVVEDAMNRANNTGKNHTEETKLKISLALTGNKLSEETKLKMSEAQTGRIVTQDTRDKISLIHSGKIVSEQGRKNMSEAHKGFKVTDITKEKLRLIRLGKPHNKIKCPHCNKEGGQNAMKRYHFDNCKTLKLSTDISEKCDVF